MVMRAGVGPSKRPDGRRRNGRQPVPVHTFSGKVIKNNENHELFSVHSRCADNDPADLFKSTANLLVKVAIVAAVVIGTIILLAVAVAPDGARDRDMSEQAVAARIQKVGTLVLGDAAGSGPRSGEDLYKGRCAACHGAGLLGAPKLADKAAWGPRIATGYAAF